MSDRIPDIDIRPLTGEDGRRQAFALFRQAMLGLPDIGRASVEAEASYLGGGDPLGGFEGDRLLGVVNGYAAAVAVPGGERVSHLSVTHVGVAPNATRQGVGRRLLVEQLIRARAQGYVVAGLRASDARIYGRYGYGLASWTIRHELDVTRTRPAVFTLRNGLREVDARESFALFRRIAETEPKPRAGTLTRWDSWWAIQEFRASHGSTPYHAVVFGAEGAERGYLRFHVEPSDNWFTSPRRTIIVDDLVAHDDETWRALIGHIFSQDILHRVVFPSRPVDDPLPLLIDDPRALEVSGQRDESWIRPLDLGRLLSALSYGRDRAVAIGVDDPLFPENAGVWTIGPEDISRSKAEPEARLAVADLTALVFGAQTASNLFAAGRLAVNTADTLHRIDELFATARKPHSGISF